MLALILLYLVKLLQAPLRVLYLCQEPTSNDCAVLESAIRALMFGMSFPGTFLWRSSSSAADSRTIALIPYRLYYHYYRALVVGGSVILQVQGCVLRMAMHFNIPR